MMETKLWVALCALLLINLGSTEHDASVNVSQEAVTLPTLILDPINHATIAPSLDGSNISTSSRGTSSLSYDTTTEGVTISLTPEAKEHDDTNIMSPSKAAIPEKNRNPTDQPSSQTLIPLSGSHAPTTNITVTSTTVSSTHTAHDSHADALTTTPLANTSQHDALPHPVSITPSNQPTPPKTHSSTSVPHTTTEPPKPETTTTTTTIAQSTSTSSTSSSQKPPMLTSPQNTSGPNRHAETSSEAHTKTTVTLPSSPSTQSKTQADTPSQLNVGGGTTMVHETPTLNPLLAGLVSAFIITAVIITLLLFLKLRRRDNRPEFHRLQDLSMDDMMEDTPLSMYNY